MTRSRRARISPRLFAFFLFSLSLVALAVWSAQQVKRPGIAAHKILVASEGTVDEPFRNAVVVIFSQNLLGAEGVIVNKPPAAAGMPPAGGPDDRKMPYTLHSLDLKSKNTIAIGTSDIGCTKGDTFPSLIRKMGDRPHLHKTFQGHVAWLPQALQREMEQGRWKLIDFDENLVFRTSPDMMWQAALQRPALPLR